MRQRVVEDRAPMRASRLSDTQSRSSLSSAILLWDPAEHGMLWVTEGREDRGRGEEGEA